jgi:hypothetical protein
MTTYRLLGCQSQKATVQDKAVMVFDIAGSDDRRFNNALPPFCKVRRDAAAPAKAREAAP